MKYSGDSLREISFPLGGIGSGSIGLSGNGRLIDWEIFNRPNKCSFNKSTHFAIRAEKGDKVYARVLNGTGVENYMGQIRKSPDCEGYGYGPESDMMYGFPRFSECEFDGEFPVAKIRFSDPKFPGRITMTAFNPFIPNDSFNSSIPGAFFEFEIENDTDDDISYQVAFSVANPFLGGSDAIITKDNVNMIMLKSNEKKDSLDYGDLCVATDSDDAILQECWYRGAWRDHIVTYWNEFSSKEGLSKRHYDQPPAKNCRDTATIGANVKVPSNKKGKVRFVLTWNVPNCYNYWMEPKYNFRDEPWKNYYTTVYEDSSYSALYSIKNFESLLKRTENFRNLLYNSTLPETVIEAAGANLSTLKSPTVLRLEDGSFYAWEGVRELHGSCEGTCQHVWNYAYAMCFLFPDLERSIRDMEFKYCTADDGKMSFRLLLPFSRGKWDFRACVDGQMGAVFKCYREWKLSGDNEWLKENWQNIKNVLAYAWSEDNPDMWDRDKDGVLEGRQHHTLDMELYGPSSWLQSMYLLAFKAAIKMAEFLGDKDACDEYKKIFDNGYKWTKENLFNGEYFFHKVNLSDKSQVDKYESESDYWNDEVNEIKYQIGEGSSIDQMLGQWHSNILGLGDVLDKEQIRKALGFMMTHNFKEDKTDFVNPWRIFSVNEEAGSIICDYPETAYKPKIPVPYCEETMTGFEYSFAGLLMSEGMIDEGIKVTKAVRDRFDGKKRNPWNEFECGSNYARTMATYGNIAILSGFEFDLPNYHIGFNPYTKDNDFSVVWSVSGAWGNFSISDKKATLSIEEGKITLESFGVRLDNVSKVYADGKQIEFEYKNGCLSFGRTVVEHKLEIV